MFAVSLCMTPLPLLRRRYLWKTPEGALIKKDLRYLAHVLLPSCLCVQLAFPGCRIKVQHATTTLTVLFAKAGTHSLRSARLPEDLTVDILFGRSRPSSLLFILTHGMELEYARKAHQRSQCGIRLQK